MSFQQRQFTQGHDCHADILIFNYVANREIFILGYGKCKQLQVMI